ncbi:MAG: enoyl-CoA hydratase-related protein [Candidatus Tectomicrobia bacterium]|nr:enoyl-CoA hydratase-related protein [Candidatus Tectomicrobia bacterium]
MTMHAQSTGFEYIQTDIKDGIGRLTLNRPEVLNALHQPMMGEIIQAVSAFEADDQVRVMLLDAAGRGFSAGGDFQFLEAMTKMTPFEVKGEVYSFFATGIKAIKLFAKPTVAAVNGPATGAGFEIALACDFRIAGENALFIQSWINLGLISPLGGMYLLPRLIGLTKATEMLMLGNPVRGPEAAEIGLVNETVADDALADRVWELAVQLAAGPPLGLRAMKEGIRRGMESTLAAEWEHNVYVQSMLLNTNDYKRGVAALRERRTPTFEGH